MAMVNSAIINPAVTSLPVILELKSFISAAKSALSLPEASCHRHVSSYN